MLWEAPSVCTTLIRVQVISTKSWQITHWSFWWNPQQSLQIWMTWSLHALHMCITSLMTLWSALSQSTWVNPCAFEVISANFSCSICWYKPRLLDCRGFNWSLVLQNELHVHPQSFIFQNFDFTWPNSHIHLFGPHWAQDRK